ncbi:transcription factor TFIIIB component B'' homolog isoform X3 [Heterocephalus glaber]|uniref:Transcription factor TFIIIB component B'' homolog isoform X3 n=1 Tax=Heterocephalus glaber TaxID=10181 RepID=A0AAX6SD07_HETGA|nr:transcription factor TFIIIB component B'' homolog isoform X3 [Heterocephalus glaber]
MFRRARLSVKPNVRHGGGARGSAAKPQRGLEAARPPEPATDPSPKPVEPTDMPVAVFRGAEPQEKAPTSSDEKIDGENNVEESYTSSSAVSLRRRLSSTSSLVEPSVSVPSQSPPLPTVNQGVPQPNPVRTKEKQLCSDRYRLYKAQKLREMLKEELRKDKKQWKNKYAINESQMPPDRSKMTMRDFIYYLPDNNPMSSSLEQEKKTEKPLTPVQAKEQESKSALDAEDYEAAEEETDDGPLLVPQVKVAEDGSIILDEESLTVEVLRTKGPCVVEENDPIFECGSTTTYSSFRKNYYSKPWSNKETDMFFLAISMVGTDFSMIGQLFPHRARIEIKNKFKREEKTNGWRIDKAFQEKRPFDFDFFAHLLQKVLAEEEKRKQKSTKNQGVKKKSSKPQKNVKVKKVTSEVVDDDPDECVSAKISDIEGSQRDAQTVTEEDSLTSSGQDAEVVLEQDQNQKRRRKKNQDGANEQEVQSLSGNAAVPLGFSEAEKDKNKCQSLRPEVNESERSEEQMPSCTQNLDDTVDLVSSETVEQRKDPILSPSHHHSNIPAATESSESSPSPVSPSEVAITALCEVNPAKQSCIKERNVDQKSQSLEASQAENVKPMLRGRLQRPKPNLSRAVGKKLVLSQAKTDAENESSHSDTSTEKNHMEKNKMNTFDSGGMENTGKENQEAETMSNLGEKTCLLEDNQPKAPRSAQPVRGRLPRPKPNVWKVTERKETITSQKEGASVEKTQNESCVNKDILQQMEDQSYKNLECEDKQPEKKDTSFQNVQPDEPRALNECLSIQEDSQANVLKQVPILRTQFQKPKPNIVRGIRRRKIPSKEEVPEESPVSGGETAALRELIRPDTSPGEKVPVVITATSKEMKSNLRETGRRDTSPSENIAEMSDVTVIMETGLKATVTESPPREKTPELIDTTGEIETDWKESRREIFPQENDPGEVKSIGETEAGLQETRRENPTGERTLEMIDPTEERGTDLEESERREIPVPGKVPKELKTIGEVETDLKDIEGEISQREKVLMGVSTLEEREIDLKETGKEDISLMETILRKTIVTEEIEADLKETETEISLREREAEQICVIEEMVADLEKTGNIDISPRENLEEPATSREIETDVMQKSSADCSIVPSLDVKNIVSEVQPVVPTSIEENNSEKELSDHLSCSKPASQISEFYKTEDQGIQPPDVSEHFSDTNLSQSLPQEQKPLEVKPAPFVRSRFKRPKPNLARATSKKVTTEAEKYVPEKKLETNHMETIEIQQDREQANTLPLQPDVTSILVSREKDKSGPKKEETVILPCIQTEKDPAPSACEPAEHSQSVQTQENDLAVPMVIQKVNTFQQEMKETVTQMVLPMRARLQRPKPNVKNARHRQVVEKGEAKGMNKNERTVLQKDETNKKSLIVSNSQIETEIEVVSSRVSECNMDENQSHEVLVGNLHVNKKNTSDAKMRFENKPCVPSPAQLIRMKFQKTKPDLGRACSRKVEEAGIEKGPADQSGASKPEEDSLHQGNLDSQLLLKEEAEIVTSPGISARKDCIGSEESVLAKKNVQLEEVGSSENVREETVQDNSASSVVEEQCFSKLTSSPQLLKESYYSKTALDGRTMISSASGSEIDHSERRMQRKIKTSVTRGRGTKRARAKTSRKEPRAPKAMLVTLRASQEEDDDDDAQDFESNYEDESCHLAPEEVNKAPVFVPLGLRSPEPVSAQIEETMEEGCQMKSVSEPISMGIKNHVAGMVEHAYNPSTGEAELEITVNVADVGCVTVVEHLLSNTDETIQKLEQENNLNMSFEMTTGEQNQDEAGTSDGSTEAAITLLTMGDLMLQSEMSTDQGDVGVCVFPDVHSKDKSHIPFSPDNVSHKIVHECQELSSFVINTSATEENKCVSEKQNREEVGLKEEIMENTTSTRSTASKVDSSFQNRSRFVRPEPNLEVLVTNRVDAHQEVSGVSKGDEVESQKETENIASKATELEDKNSGPVRTAENQEQNQLACVQHIKGTSISQEANPTARNEDQEENSQEVQMLPVAPNLSSEAGPPTLVSSGGLSKNSVEEPLIKDAKGDSVSTLHVPECTPTSIPEVQQENITNTQDLTVNLFGNVHQDGEDEQAFILTLVEIPASAAEEFTDAAAQLMPSPVLPAPILVKSGNPKEKADVSMTLPVTSVGEDTVCLSNSERADSEKSPANLDLISRKRFHCMLDESDQVPPTKKSSLILRNDLQQYTSEVCSKELNAFEEKGESHKGQGISTTSRSTYTIPEPQKERLEPVLQNKESRSLDKIIGTCIEKNMPQLSQDNAVMSDEERIDAASKSEQRGVRTKSSKAPLTRSGRRPLGFLALICSKNNLMESDEPTHVRSKKRLKPLLPVSRRNLKRSNPPNETQKKNQESSNVLPSPSDATSTQAEDAGNAATQVSCDQPSLKEECKSGQKQAPESEEPSTVSEYFFGDIFIKVDEAE